MITVPLPSLRPSCVCVDGHNRVADVPSLVNPKGQHFSTSIMTSRIAARIAMKARELIALPSVDFSSLTKATCVNGVWRPPHLRPRKVARLRKIAIAEGLDFPMPLPSLRPQIRWKPNKGRMWEREREGREAKVVTNMQKMPELVAEHRRALREARQLAREKRTQIPHFKKAITRK